MAYIYIYIIKCYHNGNICMYIYIYREMDIGTTNHTTNMMGFEQHSLQRWIPMGIKPSRNRVILWVKHGKIASGS